MNLENELVKEHSKANCTRVVNYIGSSQSRFDELFKIFMSDNQRLVQLAAWPVSYCVASHPSLIKKHFPALVKKMKQPGIHTAVRRNATRLLQDIDIPEKYQGEIMDICFRFVSDPAEKPAVKAFSLGVLSNLAIIYPEIRGELKTLIDERFNTESAAFRSRARKILSSL